MSYIKVMRDFSGLPTEAEIRSEGRLYKVSFSQDKFTFNRQPSKQVLDMLQLVYPFNEKTVLTIPEPLSVSPISGGKTILYDDMEGLLKWSAGAVDNTRAYGGSNCLRITNGGNAASTAYRDFPMPRSRKVSYEAVFAVDDWANFTNTGWSVYLFFDSGLYAAQAQMLFDRTSRTVYIYDDVGAREFTLPALPADETGVRGAWHHFKIAADFTNMMWLDADFCGYKIPFESFRLAAAASTGEMIANVQYYTGAGAAGSVSLLDNVLVTEL